MGDLPLVSVVTPSFNTARFLEETIRSVLSQDYPRIEYLVMDGGSTDGTLDILRAHAADLKYVSDADGGAADAINRGFSLAQGEILAWLNADDTYLPGAIRRAADALAANPDAMVVYGEGYWTDSAGAVLGRYPTAPFNPAMFTQECSICQPTCFIRRGAIEAAGSLDPSLRASFDYDFWIRLAKRYRFVFIPEYLATSRMHRDNKTLGDRKTVFIESIAVLKRHYQYVPLRWIYGYLSFLHDRRDQFFEPLRHSAGTYLLTLAVGIRHNPRHPLRFMAEWLLGLRPSHLLRLLRSPRWPASGGG